MYYKYKDKPFMLIQFIHQPAPGEVTSKKNWGELGNWQTKEFVMFVDRLNQDHFVDYAIIIDILNGVVIKNSLDNVSKGEIYGYFINKYKNNVLKAVDVWRKKRGVNLAKNQPNIEFKDNTAFENVTHKRSEDNSWFCFDKNFPLKNKKSIT